MPRLRAAGCSGRCLPSAAGVGAEAPADRPGILDSEGAVAVAGVFDLPGDRAMGTHGRMSALPYAGGKTAISVTPVALDPVRGT